jgi:hypothetical protein
MCAVVAARMIQWVMTRTTIAVVIGQVVVVAAPMMLQVMTVAVIVCARPMKAPSASRVAPMTLSPTIAVVDEDRVAAVDAAVTTPPATTVADVVAVATIRAKFGLPAALEG